MVIDRFTVLVKDVQGKKIKRVKIDADDVFSAHKSALDHCNALTQDITKIINADGETVFTLDNGFTY